MFGVLAYSMSLMSLRDWRASKNGFFGVLGVLDKMAYLACLKLMKCSLDVLDYGALLNCDLC